MSADEKNAINAWRRAGQELGIEVIAPFSFTTDGRRHDCIAWVGMFGRERGLVLAPTSHPEFAIDADLRRDAVREGYQWSAINVRVYATFDRAKFVEALADWGFTGPDHKRPSWLQTPDA